jgi:hypothetical protein
MPENSLQLQTQITSELNFSFANQCRASWCIADCLHIVDEQGLWMTKTEARRAGHLADMFLKCYCWLAHDAASNIELHYQWRPKIHIFHHDFAIRLPKWRLNPKSTSCFSDEDFVRRICNICSGCHHLGVMVNSLHRYLMSFLADWERQQ